MTNWSRRFDEPIDLPDGRTINTIGEAAEYALDLPSKIGRTRPCARPRLTAKPQNTVPVRFHGPHQLLLRRLWNASLSATQRGRRRAIGGDRPASWRQIVSD
jgi:hypothetical protein